MFLGDEKHIKKVQQQREQRGMLRINQRSNEVAEKENQSRSNRSISGQNNESSLTSSNRGMQKLGGPEIYKPKDTARGILGHFASACIECGISKPETRTNLGQNLSRGVASEHRLRVLFAVRHPTTSNHFL